MGSADTVTHREQEEKIQDHTIPNDLKNQTMAESRVPMTLRDVFFDDPFFKSTWEDFDVVRENMLRESRDMWKKCEEQFKRMETSVSSNMLQSSSKQMMESSSNSNKKVMDSSSMIDNKAMDSNSITNKKLAETTESDDIFNMDRRQGWLMPRRWMMPNLFNTDFSKQTDMFQNKDSEVIRMKDDKDKFEVSLDTSQYRPDELRVNVASGVISVEGKHEEKSEDGRTMVSRQFSRKYSLPAGAKQENVVSNLSSDGVLVISAPKSLALANGDRNIPIKEK